MTTIAIIQARMSSSRFPGKVLEYLDGVPMVVFMARRVARCAALDRVVLATSDQASDDPLAEHARQHGLDVFRGPLNDVLGRFVLVQAKYGADVIVRMTGDCPLADPAVIENLIALRAATGADYASNVDPRSFPHGLDGEIFTADALARAAAHARDDFDREHVTPWMRSDAAALRKANLSRETDESSLRLTVDHPEDLDVVRALVADLGAEARLDEIVAWCRDNPDVTARNAVHKIV